MNLRFHFDGLSRERYPLVHKFTPHPALTLLGNLRRPLQRKIKIQVEDEEGTKYTLALEGKVSRDKILKAVDMFEAMDVPIDQGVERPPSNGTFYSKVTTLIETGFSSAEFSSSDVAREFEEKHSQPVRLSTVSTYLSRLVDKGYLRRERFGNSWVYRRVYVRPVQSIGR